MWFWIVMAVLLLISVFLIFQCVLAWKLQSGGQNRRREEYEDEMPERRRTRSETGSGARRRRPEPTEEDEDEDEEPPQRVNGKKQWKVLLENLAEEETYSYVFYDEIGIGRAKEQPEYERFMTVEGDPKISKQHCAIVRRGNKLYVEDLGSKNGTYLNEERLSKPVVLQKEDIIRIGETEIEVMKIMRERD